MILSVAQFAVLLSAIWLAWRMLRGVSSRSTLDNIPGPAGGNWFTGHLTKLFSATAWGFHRELAEKFGSVVRVRGPFGATELYTFDPKAVHHLLVKDQNIYDESKFFFEINKIMFGEGIFTSKGDAHRRQRKMLNPVFSIAHMREMSLIFYEVAHKVRKVFEQKVKNGPAEIDVMEWMTRLALELIGQSGLGYSFDELTENAVPHRYGEAAKSLVPKQAKSIAILVPLIPYLTKIGTAKFRRAIVDLIPASELKDLKDIVDVLHETSVEIYESKKKAISEGDEALSRQIGRGKDIMSILLKANMHADEDDKLSEEQLLGQVTSLTFAATDTTSGALSRTLHLLSAHKDVQSKVREEIRQARQANGGNDIGYDTLVSLPLLDAICRETLRLHPPVSTVLRVAYKDAVLPLSTPVKGINGEYISEIPVPEGTAFHISILNSNTNPELWGPDAYEWKPERWLNPLPQSLIDARIPGVYSQLLTFIGGGRSCIGFKFSQLEMKVVLALLLEQFEFSPSGKNIFWQMTGIATPNLDANSTNPTLPMVVSLASE
ncbi:cytochrome P450 [Agrocybe pediades]|nr:cytochrome P450 [Agrocybe pediades]